MLAKILIITQLWMSVGKAPGGPDGKVPLQYSRGRANY